MSFPPYRLAFPQLPPILEPALDGEPERSIIKGIPAQSREEARVANALDRLGHDYFYQFQIFDIAGVRGSYVIDFLVTTTVPLSTPIEVFGEYWHQGLMASEDQFRLAQIEDYFRGEANQLVILWGAELQTQDEAISAVQRKIGRG